ncbi:MAG: hypothetical protein V8R89_07725 [Alphaproteobacteria bacterium]
MNAGGKNFILVFFHNPTQQKTKPSPAGRAAFPPGIFLPPKKIERRRQKLYSCFFSQPDATKGRTFPGRLRCFSARNFSPPKKRLNAGGKNFILVFFRTPTQQKTEPSPADRAAFPPGIFFPPKKD